MKTRAKENEKPDLQIRAATIETRAEGESTLVRMSVSSEEPVLTVAYVNNEYQRVYEVLDHSDISVDLSRAKDGLVVLDRHNGDQIGLMNVELRDGKMGGPVEFCSGQRAQEIGQDAAKGLRRNVSVGYMVQPDAYRIEGERDGIPVVRATRWMPYEASFEPVPADTTVGVNRADKTIPAAKTQPENNERKKAKTMEPKEMSKLFARAAKYGIDADKVEAIDMTDGVAARAALDALIVDKQTADLEQERKTVIELKERKPEAPEAAAPVPQFGEDKEERKELDKYDFRKLMRHFAGERVDVSREMEISDACAKQRNKPASGIIVPFGALAKRDFTVSGTSSATVATDLYSSEYIDLLRSNTILGELGVRFLTGLAGNVAIPKMTAGATGYWVSEGEDITESQPTMGQVTGTPHTSGALVDISRRMLLQSTPDAEMLIREEIVQRVTRALQIATFAGTGTGGQPSAITNATGINNPTITSAGTPTHAEILAFVGDILADNAAGANMRWAMTAEVWAKLADTDVDSGSGLKVLDYKSGTVVGYPYVQPCSDLPDNSLWFGDWSNVVIGIWGNGIDINVDKSTLSASGGVRLVALQDVDVMVRNGQALAYNSAVTA